MALFRKKRVDPAEVAALHVELRALRARVESAESAKVHLENQLSTLAERVEVAQTEARTAADGASRVGNRVDSISLELTNQLTELGREIDALAENAPAPDDATVTSLRSGQVKLAAEQARYQISFRDDLALLAEQVRQLRGRG